MPELRRMLNESLGGAPSEPASVGELRRRIQVRRRRRVAVRSGLALVLVGGLATGLALSVGGGSATTNLQVVGQPAPGSPSTALPAPTTSSPQVSVPADPNSICPIDASFVSATQGWVLGDRGCLPPGAAVIEATTDGGGTWTKLSSLPYMASFGVGYGVAPQPGFHGLYFADPTDGFAFGPSLASTHDGGHHWAVSPLSNVEEVVGGSGLVYAVVAPANQSDQPVTGIWRSPAGTDQWTQVALPATGIGQVYPAQLRVEGSRLVFFDPGNTGPSDSQLKGRIWTSTDQGQSWQEVGVPCLTSDDGGAAALSVATGHPQSWLVDCYNGEQSSAELQTQHHLYGSADAGAHWVRLADPVSYGNPVLLADNGAGHAFLLVVGGPGPSLVGSFDGGRSWRVLIRDNGDARLFNYNNLTFLSSMVGFAKFGQAVGPIYRTVDGGLTWQALTSPS